MIATPNKLSREEAARKEIDSTVVSRACALVLVVVVGLAILAVPAVQTAWELRQQRLEGQPLSAPQWSSFGSLPALAIAAFRAESGGFVSSLAAANLLLQKELRLREQALEDASVFGGWLMPPVQWALLSLGGVGNEQAYIGRDGWLFYKPDVEFVTGRGFLEPGVQRKRTLSAKAWETPPMTDPLAAILTFQEQLAVEGMHLLLVPIPTKAAIEPLRFTSAAGTSRVDNPDTRDFLRQLGEAGVDAIDVQSVFEELRSASGQPLYLRSDTHWRPEVMQAVAERVAAHIMERQWLSGSSTVGWTARPTQAVNTGDIADMLTLPSSYAPFPPETVMLRSVYDQEGNPWRPDRAAEVLLLGDSLANIFSLPSLGWGAHAGLAEQLSLALQTPVDRLVRNDESAYATRQMFLRESRTDPGRIRPKRVVVWQFAMRELAFGDWKLNP